MKTEQMQKWKSCLLIGNRLKRVEQRPTFWKTAIQAFHEAAASKLRASQEEYARTSVEQFQGARRKIPYVSLDSRLVINQRSFYQSCLSALYYRFAKNIDVQWADSSDAFVQSVNALVGGSGGKIPNKIILIVQHVELLRTKSTSVLKLLLKLNELTFSRIAVVTISYLPWSKMCSTSGIGGQVVQILVHAFSKAELVSKLSLRRPPDVDEKIYHLYVQLTVDVLHKSCRDPAAISYLLDKNLQPFLETLGDVSALSEGALSTHVWRALQPELSKSAGSLQVPEATMNWELPMHAKFLLIAAYIASYNPPKSDRRFFLKKGEKTKISRRELHWDDRKSAHVSGPSAFPLERMLAIFTIIIGKPVEITVEIFGLVGTLRTLGYVSQTSNDCNLDSIRLRCLATYETVSEIARSIDFDLPNYLYDFVNLKLY